MKKLLAPIAISALLLTGCGGTSESSEAESPTPTPRPTPTPTPTPTETALESAQSACYLEDSTTLGDNGSSLVLDTQGSEEYEGITTGNLFCVLDQLDIPDAVTARMESTRALDGMQDDGWANIDASWTYHPDDGLKVILSETE